MLSWLPSLGWVASTKACCFRCGGFGHDPAPCKEARGLQRIQGGHRFRALGNVWDGTETVDTDEPQSAHAFEQKSPCRDLSHWVLDSCSVLRLLGTARCCFSIVLRSGSKALNFGAPKRLPPSDALPLPPLSVPWHGRKLRTIQDLSQLLLQLV